MTGIFNVQHPIISTTRVHDNVSCESMPRLLDLILVVVVLEDVLGPSPSDDEDVRYVSRSKLSSSGSMIGGIASKSESEPSAKSDCFFSVD